MTKQLALAVLSLALLLLAFPARADEPPQGVSLQDYCAENPCRKNVKFNLRTDAGAIDEEMEMYWPVVQGEKISVLAGDVVYVEASIVDGNVTNLKAVEEISKPESTLAFSFTQVEDDLGMMLSVSNPFSSAIKFHVDMIDFQGNPHQTSSCPAIAEGGAYEMWPHPIPELVVSEIHVLGEGKSTACVY